jgi:hypothetical protein
VLLLTFVVLAPGVNVMMTNFCDLRQLSAEKMAFFLKANVKIIFSTNKQYFE